VHFLCSEAPRPGCPPLPTSPSRTSRKRTSTNKPTYCTTLSHGVRGSHKIFIIQNHERLAHGTRPPTRRRPRRGPPSGTPISTSP
jgi:hypothetical protein